MRVINYLARHGEAEGNNPQGDAARELTDHGRAHLEALVDAVRGELNVTRIVCSPLVRARQTAELMGRKLGVPVQTEDALASGVLDGPALLRLLTNQEGGVLLVGHNPEVAGAIGSAGARAPSVPPGTLAAVAVEDGRVELLWYRSQ